MVLVFGVSFGIAAAYEVRILQQTWVLFPTIKHIVSVRPLVGTRKLPWFSPYGDICAVVEVMEDVQKT